MNVFVDIYEAQIVNKAFNLSCLVSPYSPDHRAIVAHILNTTVRTASVP